MPAHMLKPIACVLISVMLLMYACPSTASADVESTAVVTSDDSGNNETEKNILVGFAVVVVAVLFWLGLKSDLEWHKTKAEVPVSGGEDGPCLVFDTSPSELGSAASLESGDTADFAGSVGVQMKF
ncbi:MAG: hypothetical protein KJ626_06290 [Verrucomicrobia bacterium]|nr:hypothetical protein [Verrucomicrobiota bacterium]